MSARFILMSSMLSSIAIACGGGDAPKVPLGSQGSPTAAITGEAKAALDSGNTLFRGKQYDEALAQYRRSASLAPHEAVPLLGVLMVADATKNTALARETLAKIRAINPELADSSSVDAHSQIMKTHPPVRTPSP